MPKGKTHPISCSKAKIMRRTNEFALVKIFSSGHYCLIRFNPHGDQVRWWLRYLIKRIRLSWGCGQPFNTIITPIKLRLRWFHENLSNAFYIYIIIIFRPTTSHVRKKLKPFYLSTLLININHITISNQLLYQVAELFFLVESCSLEPHLRHAELESQAKSD